MSCLGAPEIARVLTLGIDDPHVGDCLDCRRRLEADRATRDALRSLPSPVLTMARRKALAAEVIATMDHRPRQRRWTGAIAAGSLAAAAVLALALWPRQLRVDPFQTSAIEDREAIAIASRSSLREDAAPALASPAIAASRGTRFDHVFGIDRDTITLVDGILELDTRAARIVDIRVGDTTIAVDNASVHVEVRKRAVVSVKVVVGAVRIDTADSHLMLQRDSVWLPEPSAKTRSLSAFRDAWIELRAGRNVEAMRLFDSVTDPVVLEEASYWAAIAARRAGDPSADGRLAKFRSAYPKSDFVRP